MMRLAPEGWPFVLPGLVVTGLAAVGGTLTIGTSALVHEGLWGIAVFFGILTVFTAFFFRNPVRRRSDGEGLVLAPADGRITEIVPVEGGSLYVDPATRISIFLSVFNVHIQRSPITGQVGLKAYRPGGFTFAWESKASEDNEQSTLGIVAGPHRVMVRQIAGLVARRIVTDPEEGDLVPQGTRIGIIRFGSRVDLFIPREWELTCKVGDRTKGGLTALARVSKPREGEEN
jgi:phosphatidylserine decarboxylase